MQELNQSINRQYVFFSIVISIGYITLLNVIFGTYFSDYEVIFNALFSHTFSSAMRYDWCPNVWFLFVPIISKISSLFPTTPIYSILYTVINGFGLFVLIYCTLIIYRNKSKFLRTTIVLFGILLFNDIFINITNRSVTIFLGLTSVYSLYTYYYFYKKKYIIALSICLFSISIILRFEIALIFFFFASIYIFLFKLGKLNKFIYVYFLVSIVVLFSFNLIRYIYFEELMYVEKSEHILIDRNYTYTNELPDSTAVVERAVSMFIKDDIQYNSSIYKTIVSEDNILDYLLNGKYFKYFFNKIFFYTKDFMSKWFIEFFLFVLIGSLFYRHSKNKIQFCLFNLIFLTFFLIISFMFIFPIELLLGYLSVYCLIWLESIVKSRNRVLFLIVASVFLFVKLKGNIHIKNINEERNKYVDYFSCLTSSDRTVVYSNFVDEYKNYPSKLFKPILDKQHYYLDSFFYNNYSFYKEHNKIVFGENIGNLKDRIRKIANDKFIFVSTEDYNQFLKTYLYKVYHLKITFKQIPNNCNKNQLNMDSNIYKILIDES